MLYVGILKDYSVNTPLLDCANHQQSAAGGKNPLGKRVDEPYSCNSCSCAPHSPDHLLMTMIQALAGAICLRHLLQSHLLKSIHCSGC